ncbi:MAG: hypothetical protein JWN98_1611, partial [Abditibacteriota bacterium]|nr:hypothetical protein [Abditibacteriota bacterium]
MKPSLNSSLLHVITPSRFAGAETLLTRLSARQNVRGQRINVVSNSASPATKQLGARLAEVGVSMRATPIGGKFAPRSLLALQHAAREANADLLHSHLSTASWWCGWLDATRQFPSVGHVHGFTSALWHKRQRHLIAVSQAVKDDLVRQGIASARIGVLPNPVALDDVQLTRSAAAVRRELGAEQSTFVVGTFAHLSEKKGWRELLEAARVLCREHNDVHFWCAGDGPLREELEEEVRAHDLTGRVRFLGFRRDAADLMNAINIMALPSHREPFGLVYLEAALLGKPSIACRAGGAPEVVRHEETGLLVSPRAPEELAAAIVQMKNDR